MAKRMTDTNIWKTQRWFKKLTIEHKCAFMYIKDQCDHAGMWQIDILSLCEDVGIDDFDFAVFLHECNKDFEKISGKPIHKDRLLVIKNSTLWVTGFIHFQYQDKGFLVNPSIPAVKSALEILKGYGVYEQALEKGYFTLKEGLHNPTERAKDKDKDKDIDKEVVLQSKRDVFKKMVREAAEKKPGTYTSELLNQFFEHWTEPNKSRSKLKWEMQDTWDTGKRLNTWLRNDDKWNKSTKLTGAESTPVFVLGQKHNAAR